VFSPAPALTAIATPLPAPGGQELIAPAPVVAAPEAKPEPMGKTLPKESQAIESVKEEKETPNELANKIIPKESSMSAVDLTKTEAPKFSKPLITENTDKPNVSVLPKPLKVPKPAAGIQPATSGESLKLGNGSDTSSSSESSVGAGSKTGTAVEGTSKLPALQNPKMNAELNNIADASGDGKGKGLATDVMLSTNLGNQGKEEIHNYVQENGYNKPVEPEFVKPVNPFAPAKSGSDSGASAGAGAATESETTVGAGGSSGGGSNFIGKPLAPETQTVAGAKSKPSDTLNGIAMKNLNKTSSNKTVGEEGKETAELKAPEKSKAKLEFPTVDKESNKEKDKTGANANETLEDITNQHLASINFNQLNNETVTNKKVGGPEDITDIEKLNKAKLNKTTNVKVDNVTVEDTNNKLSNETVKIENTTNKFSNETIKIEDTTKIEMRNRTSKLEDKVKVELKNKTIDIVNLNDKSKQIEVLTKVELAKGALSKKIGKFTKEKEVEIVEVDGKSGKDFPEAKISGEVKNKLTKLTKNGKSGLGESLRLASEHKIVESLPFSLINEVGVPNPAVVGNRPIQSVYDTISDTSPTTELAASVCQGRHCINDGTAVTARLDMVTQKDQQPAVPSEPNIISEGKIKTGTTMPGNTTTDSDAAAMPGAGDLAASRNQSPESVDATKAELGTKATSNLVSPNAVTGTNSAVTSPDATNQTVAPSLPDLVSTTLKAVDGGMAAKLSGKEKLHKFFGSILVDQKKKFFVAGTASEDESQLLKLMDEGVGMANSNLSDTSEPVEHFKKAFMNTAASTSSTNHGTDESMNNALRKHNIGFKVSLSTSTKHIIQQAAAEEHKPEPKFKERSKIESNNKMDDTPSEKDETENVVIMHPKGKAALKKVFDMISEPERKKLEKQKEWDVSHTITQKNNIASIDKSIGESGDIGTTKPLQGTLIESKQAPEEKGISANPEQLNGRDELPKEGSNEKPKAFEGDLGSIVTLVGKVKVDHLNFKHATIHNASEHQKSPASSSPNTAVAAQIKDKVNQVAASKVKHVQQNTTEINAAKVDKNGPSNSLIVSSVIVVLVASFVVTGMAVVAIVAVVARHCRLGKKFDAS